MREREVSQGSHNGKAGFPTMGASLFRLLDEVAGHDIECRGDMAWTAEKMWKSAVFSANQFAKLEIWYIVMGDVGKSEWLSSFRHCEFRIALTRRFS